MNKIVFFILVFAVAIKGNGQSNMVLNDNINKIYGQFDSVKYYNTDARFDSLKEINARLAQSIIAFAYATPNFIEQDIEDTTFAVNDCFNVLSDDKNMRVVFWDDNSGGSLRVYDYIVFWKAAGKLHHKKFVSTNEDMDQSKIYFTYLDSISHIKQNDGSDLYLVMGGTLSRPYYNQRIFCYKIDVNGQFINDASVFKTGNKMLSSIDVNCPSYFDDGKSMLNFYALMHLSKDKNNLYVPIFPDLDSEDEKKAERADTKGSRKFHYFLYQFDGTKFVYKKK